MDIQSMPFAENSFDVVLCNHVLEHVNDDLVALREISRVLKPGGFAILQVPFLRLCLKLPLKIPPSHRQRKEKSIMGRQTMCADTEKIT